MTKWPCLKSDKFLLDVPEEGKRPKAEGHVDREAPHEGKEPGRLRPFPKVRDGVEQPKGREASANAIFYVVN